MISFFAANSLCQTLAYFVKYRKFSADLMFFVLNHSCKDSCQCQNSYALILWSVAQFHLQLNFHLKCGDPLALCDSMCIYHKVWSYREKEPIAFSTSIVIYCPHSLPSDARQNVWGSTSFVRNSDSSRCGHIERIKTVK